MRLLLLRGGWRSAEMRAAAKMINDLGLDGHMAAAAAAWEQAIGDLALQSEPEPESKAVRDRHLDVILASLMPNQSG